MTLNYIDLHIHSRYSRACSKDIGLGTLASNARKKGLAVLGTGDFTHPLWLEELKKLSYENGIYEYDCMKFVLSTEISLVYTQGGKGRRIHHVILAPTLDVVNQINEFLDKKGRRDYDGRPIFGFSSIELVESMVSISKDIIIIPAHCMTPWFGIFGSMSGFNSLEECFQDKTKHIHAVETGLSADPGMLWRMQQLDNVSLVSFSDAHSANALRLGRECTVVDADDINYNKIVNAIKNNTIKSTVEFFPEEGKYHFDGHRKCSFSCSPQESAKLNNRCPHCKEKLVIGVLNRVEELADRPEGFRPKNAIDFKSLLPLMEVIAGVAGTQVTSKKVSQSFNALINRFGNEFSILLDTPLGEIKKVVDDKIAEAIIKNREGKVKVIPGYDGVYGVPVFDEAEERFGKNKERIEKKKTGLERFT